MFPSPQRLVEKRRVKKESSVLEKALLISKLNTETVHIGM